MPARGVRVAAHGPLRREEPRGDGDPRVGHAAGRAALDRRGVPRRGRRAALLGPPAAIAALDPPAGPATRPASCLSVGVATTKFLAKLASDMAKPDGVLVVEPGTEQTFLAPLPLSRLWGVGPATLRSSSAWGCARSATSPRSPSTRSSPPSARVSGAHLHALARNDDDRDGRSRARRQVDRRRGDVRGRSAHGRRVRARARAAHRPRVRRLRTAGLTARTVTLKIRFADFETRTRARTLPEATDVSTVVLDVVRELLGEFDVGRGVRLLGVSLVAARRTVDRRADHARSHRRRGTPTAPRRTERRAAVERAVDEVRDRFGTALGRPGNPRRPGADRSRSDR